MNHKIYLGNSLEILKKIEQNSVDMIFADPPYGMSKSKGLSWAFSSHVTMQEVWDIFTRDELFEFNMNWISESLRVLKPGGSFWVSSPFFTLRCYRNRPHIPHLFAIVQFFHFFVINLLLVVQFLCRASVQIIKTILTLGT